MRKDAFVVFSFTFFTLRNQIYFLLNHPIHLFSAVKRKARGYRTVEYMTAMLYFVAGKLTLPCH
jgi:hypothetical protein